MKKNLILLLFIGLAVLILFYFSNKIGWYGYKKWEYRVQSKSIAESKQRNVFVKELNFMIDSTNLNKDFEFRPFIERGFKRGKHTSQETNPIKFSKFPFNFSYNQPKEGSIGIFIIKEDLNKFDSANLTWGYLREPYLKDTITLEIIGEDSIGTEMYGKIKIW